MLYVEPLTAKFKKGQADAFQAYLTRMDAGTRLTTPAEPEELLLSPGGKTLLNDYQYTSAGLRQVSTVLCYGLSTVLFDAAGIDRGKEHDPEQYDTVMAINIFNALLRRRFSRLKTRRLVRHEDEKLIDGMIGPQYVYMENAALFQSMQEAATAAVIPVEFFGSLVLGRMITVWYRSKDPIFSLPIDGKEQAFWYGTYFCNGEATSTSLRGTAVLYMRGGGCLAPIREYGGREGHLGRRFPQRAADLFRKVFTKQPDIERWKARLAHVSKLSLKLPPEQDALAKRREEISQKLAKWSDKWHPQITRDVVRDAIISGGSDADVRGGIENNPQMNARRTVYDLILATLRTSIKLGPRREAIDRLAYDLLIGKHKL